MYVAGAAKKWNRRSEEDLIIQLGWANGKHGRRTLIEACFRRAAVWLDAAISRLDIRDANATFFVAAAQALRRSSSLFSFAAAGDALFSPFLDRNVGRGNVARTRDD